MTTLLRCTKLPNQAGSQVNRLNLLIAKLTQINVVQSAGKSKEDLVVIAKFFDENLGNTPFDAICAALDEHCKRSPRFPTLYNIIEILPSVQKRTVESIALPQASERRTPGLPILLAKLVRIKISPEQRKKAIQDFQNKYVQCKNSGVKWAYGDSNDVDTDTIRDLINDFLSRPMAME